MPTLTELAQANRTEIGSRYPEQHDAEFRILEAVKDRLTERTAEGKALDLLKEIIGADEAKRQPQRPCIWIIDGETRFNEGNSSNDTLEMDVRLQIDVSYRDYEEGAKVARMLAGIAGKELLRDSEGNKEHRLGGQTFINDVWFVRSEKGPPLSQGVQSHATTYRVRFKANR